MTDGSSETLFDWQPVHVGSSWRTCPACTALTTVKRSPKSSMRLPKVGGMRDGHLYVLEMSAPRIVENAGSALLKTPTSNLGTNGGSQHPDKRKAGGHGPTLADEVEWLLPTPTAGNPNDGEDLANWEARRQRNKAKGYNGNGQGTPLAIAVQQLGSDRTPQPSSDGND